ncbi:tRNA pseudouridine(38-40) synthase TruA [Sutcliffiella deserti]|uniref:tRNA pseudouridine(38-40) synthase TruA n=1 Tax=Sutcliffiella deserti TaxID=2875501 RepID=UPI001CBD6173|nr:tRNA pseudouridine(38-40) synthase TruA [Sutcliffiella deserti]
MNKLKCVISYDGSRFEGYQIQKEKRTVQLELHRALTRIHKGFEMRVSASGRTDSGVHAIGQVIHFETPLTIQPESWKNALNAYLPKDIWVSKVTMASPAFHAQFDVVKKEYRYKVSLSKEFNVFTRNQIFHYPYKINLEAVKEAAGYLVGTHDFTSFCSIKTATTNRIRTIYELEVIATGDELVFRVVGNGFLYNMVRIIIGTLLDIGQERKKPKEILSILEARDRNAASKTAPAHGLYLWNVMYNDN